MCPAINNQILGLRGLGKSSLFTNETSQTPLIDKYLTTVVESTYTNGSNLFKKNLHPCVHNSHQTCLSNRTLHFIKVMKSLILTPKKNLGTFTRLLWILYHCNKYVHFSTTYQAIRRWQSVQLDTSLQSTQRCTIKMRACKMPGLRIPSLEAVYLWEKQSIYSVPYLILAFKATFLKIN